MRITRGRLKQLINEIISDDEHRQGQANYVNAQIGAKEILPAVLDYMGRGSDFSSAIEQAAIADFGNMLDALGIARGSEQAYEASDAYVDSFMDYIDVSPANWRQMLPEQTEI